MHGLFVDVGVWLEGLGAWAVVLAPLVMAGVAILPIPAEAPAMANGALFGPILGSIITWIGAMIGAHLSFELARWLGRPAAERWVPAHALAQVDGFTDRLGWPGLLAARLVPIVAFTALNWGAGLTDMPRWRFCWTTGLGILPAAILFTVSGTGLLSLYRRWPGTTATVVAAVVLAALAVTVVRRGRRGENVEA